VSEWLELMLGEIERKKREKTEALEENERRRDERQDDAQDPDEDGK